MKEKRHLFLKFLRAKFFGMSDIYFERLLLRIGSVGIAVGDVRRMKNYMRMIGKSFNGSRQRHFVKRREDRQISGFRLFFECELYSTAVRT
jgi:hypothetical protein